jgi:hypothetical protein
LLRSSLTVSVLLWSYHCLTWLRWRRYCTLLPVFNVNHRLGLLLLWYRQMLFSDKSLTSITMYLPFIYRCVYLTSHDLTYIYAKKLNKCMHVNLF